MLDTQTAKSLIKPHMPVMCSENGQFATVDHVEGADSIKLTRDDSGQHHYIPLNWVASVDDKVHIDRPGPVAKQQWSTEPVVMATMQTHSTTDATRGLLLGERVLVRKQELAAALDRCDVEDTLLRETLEFALATLEPMLTGDLAHPSAVVAHDLNLWLERHKHIATQDTTTDAPGYVGHAHATDLEARAASDDIVAAGPAPADADESQDDTRTS